MKLLLPFVALTLTATVAAQVHSSPTHTYGSLGGWGSVAFPGTGHPPAGGYTAARPVAGAIGVRGNPAPGYVPGYPPNRGGGYPGARHRPVPYVYAYPVYVPNYAEAAAPFQPPPNYEGYGAPPPAPTVIINQNFGPAAGYSSDYPQEAPPAEETVHVYNGTSHAPPAATEVQYYLIALKDHTIYSAVAYWVEDGTLHYVTTPNMHNQTSLDLIDAELTLKLNQDRGVAVTLAPAR